MLIKRINSRKQWLNIIFVILHSWFPWHPDAMVLMFFWHTAFETHMRYNLWSQIVITRKHIQFSFYLWNGRNSPSTATEIFRKRKILKGDGRGGIKLFVKGVCHHGLGNSCEEAGVCCDVKQDTRRRVASRMSSEETAPSHVSCSPKLSMTPSHV